MLAGQKHLAVFYDVIIPGKETPESIIPDQAFSSHVKTGTLLRFSQDFSAGEKTIRYVCFTTPQQAWRADAFFWAKQETLSGSRPFDDAYEYFIGRLLGYNESDITNFIENKSSYLTAQSGHKSP